MTIRKQDFIETGANVPDTENLINVPLQIGTVEASILITEPVDFGPVRVSLRSKGKVDVAKFAEQFGGGGHARAAGSEDGRPHRGLSPSGCCRQDAADAGLNGATAQ